MRGFASHYHIASGDDDLFVNEAATKHNSKIEVSIDSHTIVRAKKTFKDWLLQKQRHTSTFKYYNSKSKLALSLIRLSQYLFFGTFLSLLILQFNPVLVLSLFIFRFLIQIIIFNKSMNLVSEKDLLIYFPIMELVLLLIYPIIAVSNIFIRKNKWTKTNG